MDLAAVLVLSQAARLDLDRLEVELVEAVPWRRAWTGRPSSRSVLDLPDAEAARRRYEKLRPPRTFRSTRSIHPT